MSPAELMVRINASVGFVVRAHRREMAKVAGVCGLRFQADIVVSMRVAPACRTDLSRR